MKMRYFDSHLHLPSPDEGGLASLITHLGSENGPVGANLILNSLEEVEFATSTTSQLPNSVLVTVRFDAGFPARATFFGRPFSGWVKVHPRLMGMGEEMLESTLTTVAGMGSRLCGIVVDCFPWGDHNVPGFLGERADISLPLVLKLARRFPDVPVVAAHGGGYLSWAYRAHIAALPNVLVDFSASLHFYAGSDLLNPIVHYLRYAPQRFLIGSDWPTCDPDSQIAELARVAGAAGFSEKDLEKLAWENSSRLWPQAVIQ